MKRFGNKSWRIYYDLHEKDRYEKMKYELESDMNENNKIMQLSSMHILKK